MLSSCVHRSSTFNFPAGTFLLHSHWLTVGCKRLSFRHILASDISSSLSLIIASYWVRERETLPSTWILRGYRGVIGLTSILFCLREQGGLRRGNKMGNIWLEQWEHTEHLLSSCLIWVWFMVPQNKHQKPLIKDHHEKYNNNEKVWNIVGTTKTWHRDMK